MSVVAAPADKRFRRAHVKPGRRRSRWRTVARPAVAIVLVAAFGTLLFFRGAALLSRAKVLDINRIVIRGNVRVTSEAVLAALDGLEGQNLMRVDLEAWRQTLLVSPWVRDARLRRVLPSTVEVTLTERTPVSIGRFKGQLMLIDADGFIVDHFGPQHAGIDLPIVDGLDVHSPEPGAQADPMRASLAARVLASVQPHAQIAKRVSQVDVSDAHNAHVRLDGDPAVLHLGDAEFLTRIQTYLELAQALRSNVAHIQYVDLRFGERIFVGPAGRARPVSAPVGAASAPGDSSRRGRTRH
jgi:cell division protein FtsQ